MGDMYSKLGDLLNDALEKGEIPQKKSDDSNENQDLSRKTETENQNLQEDKEKKSQITKKKINIFTQKSQKPTAEVIKMHKYTQNMYISPEIQQALNTLHIAYPTTWNVIKKQYHKLVKDLHPDTKTTTQDSNSAQNNTAQSIQQLQNAYELLKSVYKK